MNMFYMLLYCSFKYTFFYEIYTFFYLVVLSRASVCEILISNLFCIHFKPAI